MTDFIIISFVFFGIATIVCILIRMNAQSPLNHKEQDNKKETANNNTEDFPFENISTEKLKKIQKDTSILAVKSVIGSILKSRGVPDDEIISLTLANSIPQKTFTQKLQMFSTKICF